MIFDGKPIDDITDEELEALVETHISERQHLEFKETYDINNRLEILRDIASLANAGGGYLIIGIRDDGTGKAAGYRHHTVEQLTAMKQSIQQSCLEHIAERIPRLESKIRTPSNNPILVIHIPDSNQAPHMVKLDRKTDFYTRYDDGKREMSIAEIRYAFQSDRMQLSLDSMSHQLIEIHKELVSYETRVLADQPIITEEPSKIETAPFFPSSYTDGNHFAQRAYDRMKTEVGDSPYLWIAVTPLVLNRDALDVHSPAIRELIDSPPGSRQAGWNMELSARIDTIPDGIERGPKDFEYLALYRNGHMEFWTPLSDHFCWTQKADEFEKAPELYPYPVVEYPVTFLWLYRAISEVTGLHGEFTINLRYLKLRGYRLRPYAPKQMGYMFADELAPFQHENLTLPPLMKSYPFDPDKTAYELLVQVYSAFGLPPKTIPFYDGGKFSFPS